MKSLINRLFFSIAPAALIVGCTISQQVKPTPRMPTPIIQPTEIEKTTPIPLVLNLGSLYPVIDPIYPIRDVDVLVTNRSAPGTGMHTTDNTYIWFEVEFFEPNLIFKILNEIEEEVFVDFITEADYNPTSHVVPNLSFKNFEYTIAQNKETVFERSYIIQIEDLYGQKLYQRVAYLVPGLRVCDVSLTRQRGMNITVDNVGSAPAFIRKSSVTLSGGYEFEDAMKNRSINPIDDCVVLFYAPPENLANLPRGIYDINFTAEDYEGRKLIDYNTRMVLD